MERAPTRFEQNVYEFVSMVPYGRVVTYAGIGRAIGCRSAQAIGQALKRNPYAPEVPCHRVIRTSLNIGGYGGVLDGEKLQEKRELLRLEGVEFDENGQLINKGAVFEFTG